VLKEYLRRNGLTRTSTSSLFLTQPGAIAQAGLIDVACCTRLTMRSGEDRAAREIFNDSVVDNGISGMLPFFTNEDFIAEHLKL